MNQRALAVIGGMLAKSQSMRASISAMSSVAVARYCWVQRSVWRSQ